MAALKKQESHVELSQRKPLQDLFEVYDTNNDGKVPSADLKKSLYHAGIAKPTVKAALKKMDPKDTGSITVDGFHEILNLPTTHVEKALRGSLVIPDWQGFIDDLKEIFHIVEENKSGLNAQYIPQLAQVDPDQFGVSVCSVDGQCWNYGDTEIPFTVQSCSKPITYCMAELDRGEEFVKQHVGHEPSGKAFNAFELNKDKIPHNPMINAGAIMAASLLKPDLEPADRFDFCIRTWNKLIFSGNMSFDNSTFLSELRHADRNFALAYFMKDCGAFDTNVSSGEDLRRNIEFYFQCCSIMGTCRQVAEVASTLANGGVQPVTGERVFPTNTVRNALSLMYSCGMYDYSGEFSYKVGLPAKSGVAGCIMLVVPNLCGICIWSPRLDAIGNSSRGVQFCEELTKRYAFHVFDDVVSGASTKKNPRVRQALDSNLNIIAEMCQSAANGDLTRLKFLVASGADVNAKDYDSRTPLHLACVEGRLNVVQYLVTKGANAEVKDRWGVTPLSEAENHSHTDVVEFLKQ